MVCIMHLHYCNSLWIRSCRYLVHMLMHTSKWTVIHEWFLSARHDCLTYWSDLIRETDVAYEESWSGLAAAVPACDAHWRIRYFSMLLSSPLPRVTESVIHSHSTMSLLLPDFNQQSHFKNRPFLMWGHRDEFKSLSESRTYDGGAVSALLCVTVIFCTPLRTNAKKQRSVALLVREAGQPECCGAKGEARAAAGDK